MIIALKRPHFFLAVGFFCHVMAISLGAQNKTIDSLKRELPHCKIDSSRTKILFYIGREGWFRRNFIDAKYYLIRSIAEAKKCNYYFHQADAYNLLANVYMKQEIFDSAFLCLNKGMEQKDDRFIPLIDETYSKIYYQLGDYKLSLRYGLKSAEGYEKSEHPEFSNQSVYAYITVGDIFKKLNQREKAYYYYEKGYKKARSVGDNWAITNSLDKIAAYFFAKNELVKARHLYDTIIYLDQESSNHEVSMFAYEGLGNLAMRQSEFKNALMYYRMALNYGLPKTMNMHVGKLFTSFASAFSALDSHDSASYYLQLAITQSKKSKDYVNLSEAYRQLSLLQQKQNLQQQALSSFQFHKAYNDSILNIEKIKTVNNLEVLYQTREKENEILRLQKAEQEKDFAINNRNIYILIGVGILLTLGVILLLLQKNYRNKRMLQDEKVKQMERQQQVMSLHAMINGQEVERKRMAKDLHDGLGGLFSTVKMYFSTLEHEHEDLRTNELFKKSYLLVDTASIELRRIAHNMMPEVLAKMGLINALRDLADTVGAGRLLKVTLKVHGMDSRLPANIEAMLYRIIQELINNIMKHAEASEAIIQLIKDDNRLSVVVEDNGCGFEVDKIDDKIHTGLESIKNRINFMNGKLTIDSQRNVGTSVMMDLTIIDD
jgi:two-component system, NarL family, sensor kinase